MTTTVEVIASRRPLSGVAIAAWAVVVTYAALAAVSIALEIAQVGRSSFVDLWIMVAIFSYAVIGALILGRYPGHPVGWLFSGAALSFVVAFFSSEYAVHALVVVPGTLPFGEAAAWFGLWADIPAIAVIGLFLPLLFPDGRLPSRRWRPIAFGAAAIVVVTAATDMLAPATYASMGYPSIRNPFGQDQLRPLFDVLQLALEPLLLAVVVVSAASLISRFRGADGVARQQLKWFAYASALVLTSFVVDEVAKVFPPLVPIADALIVVAITALPVAVGIAILRHGLYDIDLIINRTIVYVLLTAILAGVYTAAVASFQRLFVAMTGQGSDLAIIATLFVLATVFTPIKNTLQENVDRRVRPARPAPARSAIDDLVSLAELHDRGVLTDDEFAAKKKQVLGI